MAQTALKSWIVVAALLDDNKDCTLTTAWVYSYMLCKYQWFISKQQKYFESQTQISISTRVSQTSTKAAIKYLVNKGLVSVHKNSTKEKGQQSNTYTVKDIYCIYTKRARKTVHTIQPSKEEHDPF